MIIKIVIGMKQEPRVVKGLCQGWSYAANVKLKEYVWENVINYSYHKNINKVVTYPLLCGKKAHAYYSLWKII